MTEQKKERKSEREIKRKRVIENERYGDEPTRLSVCRFRTFLALALFLRPVRVVRLSKNSPLLTKQNISRF